MISFEKLTGDHWNDVKRIYQQGIETNNATFERTCPEWKVWDGSHLEKCRFIAVQDDQVIGWAALSSVSNRCVYEGVCEVSIYVDANFTGQGVGSKLMDTLIKCSEKENIWTLQAGIFPENIASIQLHKKHDFRRIGIREKIGKMNGVWRDVLLYERRSKVTGIE